MKILDIEGKLSQAFHPVFNQIVFTIDGKPIEFIIRECEYRNGDKIRIIIEREAEEV